MNTKSTARSRLFLGMILALSLVSGACGSDDREPGNAAAETPADAAVADSENSPAAGSTMLAGIRFVPPAHWSDLGPDGMRKAQYRLAPADGDDAPGEVNVFYFGPQSGGGVEANLTRWIGQISLPDGADPAAAVARSNFTADGMAGHVVSLNGTYKSGGGRPMGGDATMLPGYRLVGVVLEGPQGSLFFKLTGPQATAEAMESDLMSMVKNATR